MTVGELIEKLGQFRAPDADVVVYDGDTDAYYEPDVTRSPGVSAPVVIRAGSDA